MSETIMDIEDTRKCCNIYEIQQHGVPWCNQLIALFLMKQ